MNWFDLTVPDAGKVRDFYRNVVGWTISEVDMGGYNDYCMNVADGSKTVAGVCHARGENASLPPVWLIYITVANLEQSLRACESSGGKILMQPKSLGPQGKYAVVEDPAGAVSALFEPAKIAS